MTASKYLRSTRDAILETPNLASKKVYGITVNYDLLQMMPELYRYVTNETRSLLQASRRVKRWSARWQNKNILISSVNLRQLRKKVVSLGGRWIESRSVTSITMELWLCKVSRRGWNSLIPHGPRRAVVQCPPYRYPTRIWLVSDYKNLVTASVA